MERGGQSSPPCFHRGRQAVAQSQGLQRAVGCVLGWRGTPFWTRESSLFFWAGGSWAVGGLMFWGVRGEDGGDEG